MTPARMTDPILRRIHDNFAGAMRTMVEHCDGDVAESDGLLLCASASPSPFPWNSAIRVSGSLTAPEIESRAREFFGPRGHGFSIAALECLDDDLIAQLGEADDTSPEMIMIRAPDPFESGRVELVVTEARLHDWLEVVGAAFETLGESRDTWHACYPDLDSVANPRTVAMVVYEGADTVAGGMYYRSGSVIEVLHIGTHPEHRGRGYGRAVTTALTIHGFDNGASMASLQAEPMGISTYERIGYRTRSTYHWYVRHAPNH